MFTLPDFLSCFLFDNVVAIILLKIIDYQRNKERKLEARFFRTYIFLLVLLLIGNMGIRKGTGPLLMGNSPEKFDPASLHDWGGSLVRTALFLATISLALLVHDLYWKEKSTLVLKVAGVSVFLALLASVFLMVKV